MSESPVVAILGSIDSGDLSARQETWRSPALIAAQTIIANGMSARLIAMVSPGRAGDLFVESLATESIDTTHVQRGESTELGRNLPIDDLFTAACCIVDIDDQRLFRFLVDLPVHTHPTAQLVASLDRLVTMPPTVAREIVERVDGITGTIEEAAAMTSTDAAEDVVLALQAIMRMANLRQALLSGPSDVIHLVRREATFHAKVSPTDTSRYSSGRSLGAMASALAQRLTPEEALQIAVEATSRRTACNP